MLERPAFAFLFVLAALVAASGLTLAWSRRLEDRRHLVTGRAEWIWLTRDLPEEPAPMRFFAAREFSWGGAPAGRSRALVFVDRRYVFFVNGARVGAGEQRPGDPLHLYDVSDRIRPGRNVLEIEAASPDGVGGILFALELPGGQAVVSDRSWRVSRSEGELSAGAPAAVWGRPPMHPWGYPARPHGDWRSKIGD